ncbi:MAG: hypothetical protein V7606_1287 [Burkholderiales bacterium]
MVVDHKDNRLGLMIKAGKWRINDLAHFCDGRHIAYVSRAMSTRCLRSFNTTSAARVISVSESPCAIAASVLIEQGATILPSDWKEPVAMEPPTSHVMNNMRPCQDFVAVHVEFLMQVQYTCIGNQ